MAESLQRRLNYLLKQNAFGPREDGAKASGQGLLCPEDLLAGGLRSQRLPGSLPGFKQGWPEPRPALWPGNPTTESWRRKGIRPPACLPAGNLQAAEGPSCSGSSSAPGPVQLHKATKLPPGHSPVPPPSPKLSGLRRPPGIFFWVCGSTLLRAFHG